ncbi:glycosyltransferase family 2 protein [Billgrantia sp. C5P2]|uniref:glycosyltransferase family 2 protein n=1 Tax=Billgrantia sp. C5P2 TaxID=3436239 RepID=UPI003E9452CA
MQVTYLDLLERRERLGRNVGALDFLIEYVRKKNFLQSHDQVYYYCSEKSNKYIKAKVTNSGVGHPQKSQKLNNLVDCAAALRSVQMLQSYLELISLLIDNINALERRKQLKLLGHIKIAFLLSADQDFLVRLRKKNEAFFKKIHLPEEVIKTLDDDLGGLVRKGDSVNDLVFDAHEDAKKIEFFLRSEYIDHALFEQKFGLELNLAALKRDSDAYLKTLNRLFFESGLKGIGQVDLCSENVLSTLNVDMAEEKTSQERGLVSIIVSCFNSEDTITYALRSLLCQTYKNIEILVCDDRSEDDSLNAILALAEKDKRIKVFKSRLNQGTYNIRNALLKISEGEYISFHDSDDWAHPQKLEKQLEFMLRNDVPVCSTRWIRMDPKGRAIFFVDGKIYRFCVVSTMVKREVFSIIPKFRQSVVAADTEFHEACIQLLGEEKVKVLDKPLVLGLWGDNSLTKRNGLEAENTGHVAERRRKYSEIAARQRVFGSGIVTDNDVRDVLVENGIYREFSGVDEVKV